MARPLRIEVPDGFYHVTSRGNERKDIFKSRRDREKFLEYLESATQRYSAIIHAYCLMTNHYHLLIETPNANLSRIMQHINGSYTTYYNVKRKRSGHLLQGRYKAILVDADEYASELSRYIHLNPVRAGIVATPADYPWTSFSGYISNDRRPEWLTTAFILGYFGRSNPEEKYRQFVMDMVSADYPSPLDGAVASTLLGGEEFVVQIQESHLSQKKGERDLPALRTLARAPLPSQIQSIAETVFSGEAGLARKAAVHVCHRYCGMKLREIGETFGLSDSGVTQASRRFSDAIAGEAGLQERVDLLKKKLNL